MRQMCQLLLMRAKQKHLSIISIHHTYSEIGTMYPKMVIKGSGGHIFACDTAVIITKRKEKDGTDLVGHTFTLNIEKSRKIREGSKFPIEAFFGYKDGSTLNRWSGLLDLAIDVGFVGNEKKGWYTLPGAEKAFRKAETDSEEFWNPILENEEFKQKVKNKYSMQKVMK